MKSKFAFALSFFTLLALLLPANYASAKQGGKVTPVVGTIPVSPLGKAKLSLNTENGNLIPVIVPGTLVGVVENLGTPILAGQF